MRFLINISSDTLKGRPSPSFSLAICKILVVVFLLHLENQAEALTYDQTYAITPTIPYTTATASELADLDTVRSRLRTWFSGTSAPNISTATSFYNGLNINVSGTSISGNTPTINKASVHLLKLAQNYIHTNSSSAFEMAKNIIWLQNENGYSVGGHWDGFNLYTGRDWYQGVVLMLEHLPAGLRNKMIEASKWKFYANSAWSTTWTDDHELNSDHVYAMLRFQLGALAFIKDDHEAVRQLKGFKRYLDISNDPAKGTLNWIKPDGTSFHHWNHYNHYMYAFKAYSTVLYNLMGTSFQISLESYLKFRDMVYASLVMTHENINYAMSLGGRFPISKKAPMKERELKYLAYVGGELMGETADPLIAGEYNRIYGNEPDLSANYPVAPIPEGFWQFNWSPIAIFRKNNWVATAHGLNHTFWGTEIYAGENRYGRYQAYGALEILYPGGFDSSGYSLQGWDWNMFPGTTTKDLGFSSLNPPTDRSDERAHSNFAGALRFREMDAGNILDKGETGMYANDFQQHPDLTPTHDSTFKFKKSWFFINDFIVCLGSDIQSADQNKNIITTLFQGILSSKTIPIVLNNSSIATFPYSKIINSPEQNWLMDAYQTGYYIVSSSDALNIARRGQSSPNQSGSGSGSSGSYALAWFDHGPAPTHSTYEYVVKPGTTENDMLTFSQNMSGGSKPYQVLQQNSQGHILKWENIEAYSLFSTNTNIENTRIKANSYPLLVMLEEIEGSIDLTLVNPDLGLERRMEEWPLPQNVTLTLRGSWEITQQDEGIQLLSFTDSTTTLQFTTLNGEPYDVSLTANTGPSEHTFSITPGWTYVSFNATPDTPSADSVFGSMDAITIVKDTEGNSFWPEFGINSIGDVQTGWGYSVFADAPGALSFLGASIDPTTPIELKAGWSILGYLPSNAMSVDTALNSIKADVDLVKDYLGNVYWPEFNINQIGNMVVGQGYRVYMKNAQTLVYPPTGLKSYINPLAQSNSFKTKHYTYYPRTGVNSTLLASNIMFMGEPAPAHSEIGVFDAQDNLVGAGVVVNGKAALSIWGGGLMPSQELGPKTGERLTLRLWHNHQEYPLLVDNQKNLVYEDNAVYKPEIMEVVHVNDMQILKLFPNPFKSSLQVSFVMPKTQYVNGQHVKINLLNMKGDYITTITQRKFNEGKHSIQFSADNYHIPPGIYFIQIETKGFKELKKVLKMD